MDGDTLNVLFVLFVYVLPIVLLLSALISALRSPRLRDVERLTWVIVIIFIPCLGPILYFVIGRLGGGPGARQTYTE